MWKTFSRATLLPALLLAACASAPDVKPAYPTASASSPTATLKIDNGLNNSAFAMQPLGFEVTLDGFSPVGKETLKSGKYLPMGVTELHVPAGSHTLVHTAHLLGKTVYYFKPVEISFDTDQGKTYVIRLKKGGSVMKPGYSIEYEGWSSEQTSQWPSEVLIANPLFGH